MFHCETMPCSGLNVEFHLKKISLMILVYFIKHCFYSYTMTLSRLSFFISCHYKLNHMPFNFRAFKCSQVIQKACYNLTLHNQHILFHLRQ